MEDLEREIDILGNIVFEMEVSIGINTIYTNYTDDLVARIKNYNDRLKELTNKIVG